MGSLSDVRPFLSSTEEEVLSSEEEGEWCGESLYCFYFVKQFIYDDPEIKDKINEADNEIYQCNSERIHISNRLKAKRVERLSLVGLMDEYQEVVTEEMKSLNERLNEVKMEIELLDAQLGCVLDHRDKVFEKIKILRIKRDKGNAAYFQSRVVMKRALEFAACGNVRDLEELANSEVDRFMSSWNNDKAFRDEYKKRVLPSLDERKLSHDGRIRNSKDHVATENGNDEKAMELNRFGIEEESDYGTEEEETLKEKKREEQLQKARLAMERKRKLQEKAAAKAALRVKKEAEKKLKEREKRAKKKKKKALSEVDRTITETVTGTSDQEKEKLINRRSVFPKHRSFRYIYYGKGNENVPKAILKRRKAYRLWLWTVSSAAVALPLALLALFFYIR